MANGGPGENVVGVQLTPPTIGLFSAAESFGGLVEDSTTPGNFGGVERWGAGLYWQGDGSLADVSQILCTDGSQAFELPTRPGSVTNYPFMTYGAWECSTYQTGLLPEYIDRARRRHLAFEQYAVEKQLFEDALSIGNDLLSGSGSNSTEISATAIAPVKALARVEWEFSNVFPAPFMIHMTPLVLELILGASSQQLERRGNVWVTAMGNIVVPGRGYSGAGPTGSPATSTKQWIYASTPVQVYRGQLMSLDLPRETVSRSVNDRTVYSFRLNAVTFDSTADGGAHPLAYPADIS